MASLGSDVMARIRREEEYRIEVQKKLASQFPKRWGERAWRLLKLAIIVVTVSLAMSWYSSTFIFTNSDNLKVQRENMIFVKKLKIEIDYRATLTKEYLDNIIRYENDDESPEIMEATSGLQMQTINLARLLSQLKLIQGPNSDMQKDLDDAITSTVELQGMNTDIRSNRFGTTIADLVKRIEGQLGSLAVLTEKSYLTDEKALIDDVNK